MVYLKKCGLGGISYKRETDKAVRDVKVAENKRGQAKILQKSQADNPLLRIRNRHYNSLYAELLPHAPFFPRRRQRTLVAVVDIQDNGRFRDREQHGAAGNRVVVFVGYLRVHHKPRIRI